MLATPPNVRRFTTKLSDTFVERYRHAEVPWGPLGYITYKRTYARKVEDEGRTEEWFKTLERCCNGLLEIGGIFTQEEIEQLYDMTFHLKCNLSGRGLWQLGTETVRRIGGDSLYACWGVNVDCLDAFCFTFSQLMLGGGVGFNVQNEYVSKLPAVQFNPKICQTHSYDVDFIVPDNREGWVELLNKIFQSFFHTGRNFNYSTDCIRKRGTPIKGFGGVASGPEELVKGINHIIPILRSRHNRWLTSVDCLDIMNIIGWIVVSGNVRRSAQLSLGDATDVPYLQSKRWDLGSIPPWRAMSNNSVATEDTRNLSDEFWNGYNGNGEPYGLINLESGRQYGRLRDGAWYRPDRDITIVNPCAEIELCGYEGCNLSEIYLPNLSNTAEFIIAARLLYKASKAISNLDFVHPRTREIIHQNMRIGIGVTGLMQSNFRHDPLHFEEAYSALEEEDSRHSKLMNVPKSIKLTTVKPSGTLSLLPGVTPGVHPAYSPYHVRRMRFASNKALWKVCRDHGYPIEPAMNIDGSIDEKAMIVVFPVKTPDNAVCAKDMTAIKQLEWQKWIQTHWADNSVSATVYYRSEELPGIKSWLKDNYQDSVKTVSFLLHSGHGFKQPVLEEISRDQYLDIDRNCRPIQSVGNIDTADEDTDANQECSSGVCPVR